MKQKKNNFIWIMVLIMSFVFGASMLTKGTGTTIGLPTQLKTISQDQFLNQLESGNIKTVNQTITYEISTYSGELVEKENDKDVVYKYETKLSRNMDKTVADLTKANEIQHYVSKSYGKAIYSMLASIAMFIFIFIIFRMIMKGAGKGMMGASESKAKMVSNSEYTFADVIGYDEVKDELSEIADFINNPAKYKELNANVPNGILLEGPPGTGKTLMAKALAGETNAKFIYLSGSDFIEMFVGVGASRVRKLYDDAKKNSPCIIFIDEIDAIGSRDQGPGGSSKEHEQTINALLVELDGFAAEKGKGLVFTIGATNRKENLDKALLRPGRFDMHVKMGNPNFGEREEMLKYYANKTHVHPDVDLKEISRSTTGMSGAHLARIINDGALLAVRDNRKLITKDDIEEAIDRVHMGPAKKNEVYSERKKTLVSYHEAGHAIIGLELEDNGHAVQKITIVPRGSAGGYVMYREKEGSLDEMVTKTEMISSIITACGGRAAEELFIGEISVGASQDFEQATSIAIQMVKYYGFSDMGIYQTISNKVNIDHSEEYRKKADEEIKNILQECYEKAKEILTRRSDDMHLLAKTIQEKETLYYDDIVNLIKYRKLVDEDQNVYFTDDENEKLKDKNNEVLDQIKKDGNISSNEALMKKNDGN